MGGDIPPFLHYKMDVPLGSERRAFQRNYVVDTKRERGWMWAMLATIHAGTSHGLN